MAEPRAHHLRQWHIGWRDRTARADTVTLRVRGGAWRFALLESAHRFLDQTAETDHAQVGGAKVLDRTIARRLAMTGAACSRVAAAKSSGIDQRDGGHG